MIHSNNLLYFLTLKNKLITHFDEVRMFHNLSMKNDKNKFQSIEIKIE